MAQIVKEGRKPRGRPRTKLPAPILNTLPNGDSGGKGTKTVTEDCPGSIPGTLAVSLHGPQEPTIQPTPDPASSIDHSPGDAKPPTNTPSLPSSKLTLKQRAFVRAYANPNSKTFGNGTQSAILAKMGNTIGTSAGYASDLIRKPEIASEISRTFEKYQVTVEDRTGALSDLLHQCDTITQQLDPEGRVLSQVRADNGKIRLAAVRELNRMDGTYARADGVAKAQRDAVQPLVAHYAQQLRDALKEEDRLAARTGIQPSKAGQGEVIEGESTVEGMGEQEGEPEEGGEGVPPMGVSL